MLGFIDLSHDSELCSISHRMLAFYDDEISRVEHFLLHTITSVIVLGEIPVLQTSLVHAFDKRIKWCVILNPYDFYIYVILFS